MTIWQIATGEVGRNYSSLFFDHDIMILGPSDGGDAQKNPEKYKGNRVYNFFQYPKPGDLVLMRYNKEVIGIGLIPSEPDNQYSFQEIFRSVYGWDLCHTRRVIWTTEVIAEIKNIFSGLNRQQAFSRVHNEAVHEYLKDIDISHFSRSLKELPDIDDEEYSNEELGIELFRRGISLRNIEEIINALNQADRLLKWYWLEKDNGGRSPSEKEIVAHIILPLFLGLGWSHQQIAVEWNRVDVAFFKQTPTDEQNCIMVLEAKGLGKPLDNVFVQPMSYINELELDNVALIVTTDGNNIFVYDANDENKDPIGFIDIANLRHEYVLPKKINIVDTLVKLQPSSL